MPARGPRSQARSSRERPGNGMPDQPMTERGAHDLAAYLYTLTKSE